LQFVGKINFGTSFALWNPCEYAKFGPKFKAMALTLFKCQRRPGCALGVLNDQCLFYILNMCRWDWADDAVNVTDDGSWFVGDASPEHAHEDGDESEGSDWSDKASARRVNLPNGRFIPSSSSEDDEACADDDEEEEEHEGEEDQ
jgi:hypothetical protein